MRIKGRVINVLCTCVLFYTCECAHIICMELPPNLSPPIFLFRSLGTKPPNLKIANISGYTVYRQVYYTGEILVFFFIFWGDYANSLRNTHPCNGEMTQDSPQNSHKQESNVQSVYEASSSLTLHKSHISRG